MKGGDSGVCYGGGGPGASQAFGNPTASTLSWYDPGSPVTRDSDGVALKPGRRVADPGTERWRLIILTSAMLSVQCCYSVQINRGYGVFERVVEEADDDEVEEKDPVSE